MTRGEKGQTGEHYKKEKAKTQHELAGPLATASRRTTPISTPRGDVINFKGKTTKEKVTTTRVLRGDHTPQRQQRRGQMGRQKQTERPLGNIYPLDRPDPTIRQRPLNPHNKFNLSSGSSNRKHRLGLIYRPTRGTKKLQ